MQSIKSRANGYYEQWIRSDDKDDNDNENFKLHVGLPIDAFTTTESYFQLMDKIIELLKNALQLGMIISFKFIKPEDLDFLKENIRKKELQVLRLDSYNEEDERFLRTYDRVLNNPIAIYIKDNFDEILVGELISQLEGLISAIIHNSAMQKITDADVEILPHITFRQHFLKDSTEYKGIPDCTVQELRLLGENARDTKEYKKLHAQVETSTPRFFLTWYAPANKTLEEKCLALLKKEIDDQNEQVSCAFFRSESELEKIRRLAIKNKYSHSQILAELKKIKPTDKLDLSSVCDFMERRCEGELAIKRVRNFGSNNPGDSKKPAA